MKFRRIAALFTALAMVMLILPRFEINAQAAKKTDFHGCSIPANAEELCFCCDVTNDDMADMYVLMYTGNTYSRYYSIPVSSLDCKEIVKAFPRLKRLAVIYGDPVNIDALAELKSLTALEIYGRSEVTSDISFLKKLGGRLKTFHYHNVECRGLSPLKYLTNVSDLDLYLHWQAGDPGKYIKKFTGLKRLELYTAEIENVDFLSGLKKLTRLSLDCSNLSDISGIKKLRRLKELEISSNNDSLDLSPIKNLASLERLTLGRCGKDISVISGLSTLVSLYLNNYVYNYSVTASDIKKAVMPLTCLESLTLQDCGKFGDLDFLAWNRNLKSLYIFDGAISSVSGIKNLTGLEALEIMYNYFHFDGKLDISPLKNLTGLRVLGLSETPVKDISAVKNMKKLEWLGISGTGAADLSPLMGLKNLKRLVAYSCEDMETLEKFHKKYPGCEIIPYYSEEED